MSHVQNGLDTIGGKRLILIADDELTNREILRETLQADYDIVFATNGKETMEMMREHAGLLSLVLLDLMMPVMSGIEVLKAAKADPKLSQIPVIVLTADQEAEVESLTLGAIDFIPKPYPQSSVILARVLRIIELYEDRQIIDSTERDSLTGLYNKEYFYRYVERIDRFNSTGAFDAIVIDVNRFHMVNERLGSAYGDSVLIQIADNLQSAMREYDGIVCRREADTFMAYCPHIDDAHEFLELASKSVTNGDGKASRIWLRMGIYPNADKALQVERRFARAKTACDFVKGNFTSPIGWFDQALYDREILEGQLIEDFPMALEGGQFDVHYQPKFDVRGDAPVLASAEALVRWQHPVLGMIAPFDFIPLFEENGLIQQLDLYVWRKAARQIKDWKERIGFTVPLSVNVSRVDMFDPLLVDSLLDILNENELSADELLLEITESAYTQDSAQIVDAVNILRRLGFQIEMDDFGTGYSSLNMISTLPIDALKLDMQFIRNAFGERQDTRLVEIIIDIADYLGVPVIAEGVETEEQMLTLKEMGCDYVQGYYFSRPVPAADFEPFLLEAKHA